jgi:hypothetical protein
MNTVLSLVIQSFTEIGFLNFNIVTNCINIVSAHFGGLTYSKTRIFFDMILWSIWAERKYIPLCK